ncbi:FAD:protein FMN transferase [Lentisphaera profundi]|uniref:FAD:protein FMN transferase n=1 Tax=Lentisphaera profundi TaxID=1658616 RepID=A0ABY7VVH8_9BACT|nr:FAD:protein FMN transferase [Lentisphaera profundi]WDE97289.1 FAD:protein FMN transferase [Lentisphaera profundi]
MNNLLNRRHFLSLSSGASLMLLGLNGHSQTTSLQKHVRCSFALGTKITFTVFHEDEKLANQAIDEALLQIDKVENVMSLYRPDSQLSQLNREGLLRKPHPLFVDTLKRAQEISALSDGAFDITVQPLWNLFRQHSIKGTIPNQDEVAKVKKRVGWQFIDIQDDLICMNKAGGQISLNGIAQGLAADVAQQALKARGIEHALIDAGELSSLGKPQNREAWKIGIQHSRKDEYLGKINLKNRCLSTSGDYQVKFSEDFRLNHLFDPRTGYSPTELSSVSVLAPSAMQADALSTALFVLGQEKAMKLMKNLPQVDAFFVNKKGHIQHTEGFGLA